MPAPHQFFLHAGCPSCHPTNSFKALKALICRKKMNAKFPTIIMLFYFKLIFNFRKCDKLSSFNKSAIWY